MGDPAVHATQTECLRGHPLTDDNVILKPNSAHGGVSRHCLTCSRIRTREQGWRRIGVTPEAVEAAWIAQDGRCAVCRTEFEEWDPSAGGRQLGIAHPDHDHETGVFRGLLCRPCNLMLGHGDDDPQVLRRAADYIEASRRSE